MGKNNSIFSHKLKSDFEIELVNIYVLARKSNGFGIEVEYQIVKDYCLKFDYDFLEVFKILKNLNQKVIS